MLVFRFIPGGVAIRVPNRINHVITIGFTVLLAIGLQWLIQIGRSQSTAKKNAWRVVCVGLGSLLLLEQVNNTPVALISRSSERAFFSRFAAPPPVCSTVFLTNLRPPIVVGQMDAMLLAREWGIPTINGYSGLVPPGRRLFGLDSDYISMAQVYALRNGLSSGLCSADSNTGQWHLVDFNKFGVYRIGDVINFASGGNGASYELDGWSVPEPGGSWTLGSRAELRMRLEPTPATSLQMKCDVFAFTPPIRPKFVAQVLVNGSRVGEWSFGADSPSGARSMVIPSHLLTGETLNVTFELSDPRSPAELGVSADERPLSFSLQKFVLEKLAGESTTR